MKKTAIGLMVLALVGCGKNEVKTAEIKPVEVAQVAPSLYAKVASIDAGTKLVEDSIQVVRVKKSIQQSAALCKLTEDEVSGKVVKVKTMLEDEKISVQSVDLLEMIPLVYREKTLNDCVNILVHYATIRKGGLNHAETVAGLNALSKVSSK